MFIRTPKEYVQNFFGRLQLTVTNLFFTLLALGGFKPEATTGVYDRGDTNEKRPSVPLDKVAGYVLWATQTMNHLGLKQTENGMFDCPNTSRMKAELVNAKAAMDGYKGASIAGTFGYTRDSDGRGHEVTQILYDGDKRIFAEGHQGYSNLRGLSKSELASCQLDIIG